MLIMWVQFMQLHLIVREERRTGVSPALEKEPVPCTPSCPDPITAAAGHTVTALAPTA